ncbi:hypothetical protein ACFQZC_15805 [Streptacidiphilus monticola]
MKIDDAARLRVPRQVAWPGRRPAPPGDRPGRPGTRGGPGGLLLDLLLAAALLAVTAWAVALPARAVATQLGWRGIAAVYVASACRQIPSPTRRAGTGGCAPGTCPPTTGSPCCARRSRWSPRTPSPDGR